MQIILSTDQKKDKLTIILPERLVSKEKEILDALHRTNELEYFLTEDFVRIELKFVTNDFFSRYHQSLTDVFIEKLILNEDQTVYERQLI